jgi:hypothetical protein
MYIHDGHEIATNVCCNNNNNNNNNNNKLLEKGAKNQSDEITGLCEPFEEFIARLLFCKDVTGKLSSLVVFTKSFENVTGYRKFF